MLNGGQTLITLFEFLALGTEATKSLGLEFVSVQPADFLFAAVELVNAVPVGPVPSKPVVTNKKAPTLVSAF